MYVLALLFGIVNFYFLLSALIVILSLFMEYVLVPLINRGAKLFHLPICFNLERIHPSNGNNPNVFNTIFNQDKLEKDDSTDDSNDDLYNDDDENDEDNNSQDKNESTEVKKPYENTNTEESDQQNNQDNQSNITQSNLDQDIFELINPSPIIIDETLD